MHSGLTNGVLIMSNSNKRPPGDPMDLGNMRKLAKQERAEAVISMAPQLKTIALLQHCWTGWL